MVESWRWVVVAGALASGTSAYACAGLVHEVGALAESDHAEVAFEVGSGEVAVSYAVAYTGDAADFGWVIPVPGEVAAVDDGDVGLFTALRERSAPLVNYGSSAESDSGGCGCLFGAGSKAGGTRSNDGVTVLDEGFTGTYDYVVITATDAGDLDAWFADHGWEGLAADDLSHYVDLGATFVALQVTPASATTPASGAALPPVRIRYAGDELRFPSVMARHGLVDAQRTTAYVVADSRAKAVAGWTSEDGGTLLGDPEDPELAFLARLGVLGEDRAWLRTWAGTFVTDGGDERFATRFDTYAPTDVHDADAVFGLEASTEPLSTTIDVSQEEMAAGGIALLGMFGWRLRRRS